MSFFQGITRTFRRPQPFDLDYCLLALPSGDKWTVSDAVCGTAIMGATGSGKTSGSGHTIAKAFLRGGYGGLVMVAKVDELALWQRWAEACGRSDDLVVFSPNERQSFNFLDYEMKRSGAGAGFTINVAHLFEAVLEITRKDQGRTSSEQQFWKDAAREMILCAADIAAFGKDGRLTLEALYDIMNGAPDHPGRIDDAEWMANSSLMRRIRDASARSMTEAQRADLDIAADYWARRFPNLAPDTRSSVLITFTAMASTFLHSPFRELFCAGTTITPEATFDGKIIVVNLPVKEWGKIGQAAQIIWKFLWQQAVERRDLVKHPRPVFLWADESPFFVTSQDRSFLATARSKKAMAVYLSQSLPSYQAELGPDSDNAVKTVLGNLTTKIFHSNGCHATNEWAANTLGKVWQTRSSANVSRRGNGFASIWEVLAPQFTASRGTQDALEFQVEPADFTGLRKGGHRYQGVVEGILFQDGRVFRASGTNFLRLTFSQG